METNLSISGVYTNKLKVTYKIGTALFLAGLLILSDGYFYHWLFKLKLAQVMGFAAMILGSILFTYDSTRQFSPVSWYFKRINAVQKIGLIISLIGWSIILAAWCGYHFRSPGIALSLSFVMMAFGISVYTYGTYAHHPKGIKNNYVMFNSLTARGLLGWIAGIALTWFYIQLYWFDEPLQALVRLFDPLSMILVGHVADKWFVYGSLYTFLILFLGIKFMIKYRHNRYQLVRTVVVILSQLVLAYFLPQIMEGLAFDNSSNAAGEYLGYYDANPIKSWPLNYDFFTSGHLEAYAQEAYQPIGMAYLFWGILLFLVVTPVVTYYVGKRWYCSWFCGCGGLAETAGDGFRQLSSRSLTAWKIERWVMHSVMVFVLLMTIAILLPFFSGKEYVIGFLSVNKNLFFIATSVVLLLAALVLFRWYNKTGKTRKVLLIGAILFIFCVVMLTIAYATGGSNVFLIKSTALKKAYGFFVGSAFSGVIGVGFYPILGNRVWCRFGCPMAGYMGLFQRFKSRFRITTNGGQCISCGNCSTYCEQGIDVRAYAQRGQNIVRSSCVGCGICSAVCPRGVLKLENGPEEGRLSDEPNLIGMLKNSEG